MAYQAVYLTFSNKAKAIDFQNFLASVGLLVKVSKRGNKIGLLIPNNDWGNVERLHAKWSASKRKNPLSKSRKNVGGITLKRRYTKSRKNPIESISSVGEGWQAAHAFRQLPDGRVQILTNPGGRVPKVRMNNPSEDPKIKVPKLTVTQLERLWDIDYSQSQIPGHSNKVRWSNNVLTEGIKPTFKVIHPDNGKMVYGVAPKTWITRVKHIK